MSIVQNKNRNRKDESGKYFGKWKVIGISSKTGRNQTVYWICLCECGKIKDIKGTSLRDGSSTCCGCSKPLKLEQTPESIYKKYYRSYKYGCKRKTNTYDFEISYEFYRQLVNKNCHFCGQEPYDVRFLYNRKRKKSVNLDVSVKMNGVDRLDNLKGYTEDNCVPCCKMCNLMKLDSTEDQFLRQVKLIYENRSDEIEKISDCM